MAWLAVVGPIQKSELIDMISAQSIDLTGLWKVAHPHLVPYLPDRAFQADPREQCPHCDAPHGQMIGAHLQFRNDLWVRNVDVTYCPETEGFHLPLAQLQSIQTRAGLAADELPTAIDGRLWLQSPTILNIEPTTRCNFSCWYCVGRHMVQEDIDLGNFGAMLDNFANLQAIALVGEGEPLLHKDFFKMVKLATEREIQVLTISNGSAFSKSVVRQLCESGVRYVSISIDSHIPQEFSASRIDGNLEKVWAGIRQLRDYRDANGFSYPKIGLKGTLFSATRNHLRQIVDAAVDHGVEIFESFQPLNPKTSYIEFYPKVHLKEIETIDAVQQTIVADSAYGLSKMKSFQQFCSDEGLSFFPETYQKNRGHSCHETWLYSLLSGNVTPCCQIKTPPENDWNIFDRPVQDILSSPSYENMRFNLWNGVFPNYCSGCWKTR